MGLITPKSWWFINKSDNEVSGISIMLCVVVAPPTPPPFPSPPVLEWLVTDTVIAWIKLHLAFSASNMLCGLTGLLHWVQHSHRELRIFFIFDTSHRSQNGICIIRFRYCLIWSGIGYCGCTRVCNSCVISTCDSAKNSSCTFLPAVF